MNLREGVKGVEGVGVGSSYGLRIRIINYNYQNSMLCSVIHLALLVFALLTNHLMLLDAIVIEVPATHPTLGHIVGWRLRRLLQRSENTNIEVDMDLGTIVLYF